MTVEEIRRDNDNDNFPIGMRVLAVDDDPICLKLLETHLRKCQYHVTTTNQARIALKMLRENKDRFDLVISDVHMPDMDGFKLLELVGLEMDLPVIMLSANGDPKLVMKGVTHGACDYLVKPVRNEELRNIWQHVIRKKKVDPKGQSKSGDQVKANQGNGEVHGSPMRGNADQNGKVNRKRKDEDDDSEDDGNDSEDPGTQKKPRVVWSIELHRKFVAAVNQLGIEKAVPKRILDLMNVEGLTRENVASHLQKYRLYLKRISSVANQQVNMAAALGVKDASFMRIGSLDGYGDFRSLTGTGRLANVALSPYTTGGMLGRLNSPANVNLRNLSPSPFIQPQNLSNPITSFGKVHHPNLSPAGQNPCLFQGIPSSLDLDQLQNNKCAPGVANFNAIDESRIFNPGNPFSDPGAAISSSSNLLNNTANNSLMLHGNVNGGGFGSHSSHNMSSFNSESFNAGVTVSSNLLDPVTIEPYKMQPNSLLSTEPFHSQLPINRENNSSHFLPNNAVELSSTNMASVPLEDSRGLQNYGHSLNNSFGSFNSHIPGNGILSPSNRGLDQSSGVFNQKMQMPVNGRGGPNLMQQNNDNEKSSTEPRTRSNENFLLDQPEMQGGFVPQQGFDSLDILMNSMIKREQDGPLPTCDFGFDDYSFAPGL